MNFLGLAILLSVGLLLGWLALTVHTAWTLIFPPRRTYGWAVARNFPGDPSELRLANTPPESRLNWSAWSLRTGGIDLPVWEIDGLNHDGPVVILTHGWSDSRVTMLASGRAAALLPVVSRLVLWDLPGHGDAPRGTRCGLGDQREVAALLALIERIDAGPRGVVLHGFSLGARISVLAACRRNDVVAVIAEAPYRHPSTPAHNVLRMRGLPYRTNLPPAMTLIRMLARSEWASPLSAEHLKCPLLVIHGTDDVVSPIEDGRALARTAEHSRLASIEGARHQSMWFDDQTAPTAAASVREFLTDVCAQTASARPGSSTAPAANA